MRSQGSTLSRLTAKAPRECDEMVRNRQEGLIIKGSQQPDLRFGSYGEPSSTFKNNFLNMD